MERLASGAVGTATSCSADTARFTIAGPPIVESEPTPRSKSASVTPRRISWIRVPTPSKTERIRHAFGWWVQSPCSEKHSKTRIGPSISSTSLSTVISEGSPASKNPPLGPLWLRRIPPRQSCCRILERNALGIRKSSQI